MGQEATEPGFKFGHLAPGPCFYHRTEAALPGDLEALGNMGLPVGQCARRPLQIPRAYMRTVTQSQHSGRTRWEGSHLILTPTPCAHFTDEETEALNAYVCCPRS